MIFEPMHIPTEESQFCEYIEGGVCAPLGFRSSGVAAGFRKDPDRGDLAIVACDHVAAAAGVFTRNRFCAAPVAFDREQLAANGGRACAVVVNAGIANAATGETGLANARRTAGLVAEALGVGPSDVLVASTGVIGRHLPMDVMERGVLLAVSGLGGDAEHDLAAARAITTTDTRPKRAAVSYLDESGNTYRVGGMCKGSGMISPNMATMIAVLTTDAPVGAAALQAALRAAADASFNRVTVDSDTSTNDTCLVLASGDAGGEGIESAAGARFEAFQAALTQVATSLAQQIASDGEGATKLVRVVVTGAATDADAQAAARTVADSPLVKTAIAGHDANWGRIAAALGRSGASFEQLDVDIDILGIPVCRGGMVVDFDEGEALRRFEEPRVDIVCDLGAGGASATVWTCDLTHDYISINADYRS